MEKFFYLNYDEVNRRLDRLVNRTGHSIVLREEYPLGFTDFNLPIRHFSMGSGKKHIIVTGSYHAAEIITTIFVVHLMEDLVMNNSGIDFLEYTIHFIPIMNPEGYLVTSSMQDLMLNRCNGEEEKLQFAKKYWAAYREDAIETIKAKKILCDDSISEREKQEAKKKLLAKKKYQRLFDGIIEEDFLKDYPELRESVMNIIRDNDYPVGVGAAWTSNGHGIDLSANVPFNQNIEKYKQQETYAGTVYSNIRCDKPGPINCPCRNLDNFTFERENLHLMNFLEFLSHRENEEIVAFLNYHSVMGKIYQRPVNNEGMMPYVKGSLRRKVIENYLGARLFREENAYDIILREDPYNYINEYFRLKYGINIQVELSRMGSNPIGPLADSDTFRNVTLKPNIEAFKNFIRNMNAIRILERVVKEVVDVNTNPLDVYKIIDKMIENNNGNYAQIRENLNRDYSFQVVSYYVEQLKQCLNNKDDLELNGELGQIIMKLKDFVSRTLGRSLTDEEVKVLINSICLDYPDIMGRIKMLVSDGKREHIYELYQKLEMLVGNQIKMNNLVLKK